MSNYMRDRMSELSLDQRDLALQCCMPYQNVSAVLSGKRRLTLEQSVLLDDCLGLEKGTLYQLQALEEVKTYSEKQLPSAKKWKILVKVKKNGGLWSYDGIPKSFSDDDIIEEGLRHLDFEDMHLLFELWSQSHVKRVWKERLVSEGKRTNILNTLLGIIFFGMDDVKIKRYLKYYGHY